MNKNAQINCISNILTKKWRLRNIDKLFIKTKIFQKDIITFINIFKIKVRVRNRVAREHVFIEIFYVFSKVSLNIIVKLLWMMKTNSHVDWTILTWCFEINFENITIQFFKIFFNLNRRSSPSGRSAVSRSASTQSTNQFNRSHIQFSSPLSFHLYYIIKMLSRNIQRARKMYRRDHWSSICRFMVIDVQIRSSFQYFEIHFARLLK